MDTAHSYHVHRRERVHCYENNAIKVSLKYNYALIYEAQDSKPMVAWMQWNPITDIWVKIIRRNNEVKRQL